ncbi:MAG TPA: hypothetical protein P5509_08520 [Bacteroidales bacterium]|nr:hypothetical protein [Bacteroidales bacterium]
MKKYKILIEEHKDTNAAEIAYDLLWDNFKKKHANLTGDVLSGEYINLEVEVDENFNIVGGKIIPHKPIEL